MREPADDQRTVVTFADRAEAEAEAARLVNAGIGATVDLHVPEPRPESPTADEPHDAPRENLWASLVSDPDGPDAASSGGRADEVGLASMPDGPPEASPRDAELPAAGMGAAPVGDPPRDDAAAGDEPVLWDVRVLLVDLPRACEELGLPAPPPEEKAKRQLPPWAAVLIIWLVAMVTLPLLAFWITVNVLD